VSIDGSVTMSPECCSTIVLGLRAHYHVTDALHELHCRAACQISDTIQALLADALRLNPAMLGLSQSTSSACRQLNLSSRTEVVEQSVLCSPKNSNETGWTCCFCCWSLSVECTSRQLTLLGFNLSSNRV